MGCLAYLPSYLPERGHGHRHGRVQLQCGQQELKSRPVKRCTPHDPDILFDGQRAPFVVCEDIRGPQLMEGWQGQHPQQEAFGRGFCRPVTSHEKHRKDDLGIPPQYAGSHLP